jgi:methyl-accepting chemotaxis protein
MKRIADVVRRSTIAVKDLGKSGDRIGEIVSVIDDIADQTNLLALNAAIEAARVGEAGRGFAVVADEVRKLADRTTGATKEIAAMIREIQNQTEGAVATMESGDREVDSGIAMADRAGVALHAIVESSSRLTDMVAQIAAASEEQSRSSENISDSVETINRVSGETSQGSHQIARAAEDLNRLTERLRHAVASFRTGAGSCAVSAPTQKQPVKAKGGELALA